MELADLLKKASQGELQCPRCGAGGISLRDVRVGVAGAGVTPGKPQLTSGYGLCGKCGITIPIETLREMLAHPAAGDKTSDFPAAGKKWWRFWD
jgi:hypothetical protein